MKSPMAALAASLIALLPATAAAVEEAGYSDWVGIEYEGDNLPEDTGIRKTKALLERVRDQLA